MGSSRIRRLGGTGAVVLAGILSSCGSDAATTASTPSAVSTAPVAETAASAAPVATNADPVATDAPPDTAAPAESAVPPESAPPEESTAAAPADPAVVLTSAGETTTWTLVSRSEGGAAPAAPKCTRDDLLVFKVGGKFDSVIGDTPCNPSEVPVVDGDYTLSADGTVLTFTVPGFSYTGKLIEVMENRLVIEFDLGGGFVVTDEFILES
jgi:hypothetical protein